MKDMEMFEYQTRNSIKLKIVKRSSMQVAWRIFFFFFFLRRMSKVTEMFWLSGKITEMFRLSCKITELFQLFCK